ncbi:hypothetical protein [Desulfocastanea catecholica]
MSPAISPTAEDPEESTRGSDGSLQYMAISCPRDTSDLPLPAANRKRQGGSCSLCWQGEAGKFSYGNAFAIPAWNSVRWIFF